MDKQYLQMASTSKDVNYFIDPLIAVLASVGVEDVTFDAVANHQLSISIAGVEMPVVEALLYQAVSIAELDDHFSIHISADDTVTMTVADWQEEEEDLLSVNAAKKPMEDDEPELEADDEEEDEGEYEEGDAIDEDTPTIPAKVKKKIDKKAIGKLAILTTPEAQKMVSRMYNLSGGDDMSHFPQFWQEVDEVCKKFRGQTGYVPDEPDDVNAALTVEASLLQHLDMIIAKSKKKKGFKEGRGGFLSTVMKAVAADGDKIDAAWTNLDADAITNLMIKIGSAVVDAVVEERDKRGLETADPEDSGDDEASEE